MADNHNIDNSPAVPLVVIIAGSRGFDDYEVLYKEADRLIPFDATIMSGGADGADSLGERFADETGERAVSMSC